MTLPEDVRDLIELLNVKQVQFVVIGGLAVAFHGHSRSLRDFDLFIDDSHENLERLIAALVQFGFDEADLRKQDFRDHDSFVMIHVPPYRVDFISGLDGVSSDEIWTARVAGTLAGLPVSYISREHLVRVKRIASREKDLADLAALESAANTEAAS